MTTTEPIVSEDISGTIDLDQTVYDKDGKKVGEVDLIERETGYFLVQTNPFSDKDLYVPFSLITNIDRRELFVSVSRKELHRDYTNPPPTFTTLVRRDRGEVAITTEPSGYTGAPIVVNHTKIDELKDRIAVGDHVLTSEMTDLGTIKRYDPVTGWMLVEQGVLRNQHDLMIPVTVVAAVNTEDREVYLVASEADLQRMQHLRPAYVVFPDARM